MSAQEIAQNLVEHCKNHTEAEALKTLYADNAVSIEPMAPEGVTPVSEGATQFRVSMTGGEQTSRSIARNWKGHSSTATISA